MIKINERYYIDADTHCYVLREKKQIQDESSKNYGNYIYKDLGYYVTIEQAINGFIKKALREYISTEDEKSIADLKKEFKKLQDFIKKLDLDI
jgi:hypothetical protein